MLARLWRGTDDFLGSNDKDQGLCSKQGSKHKKAFMRLRRIGPDGPPARLRPVGDYAPEGRAYASESDWCGSVSDQNQKDRSSGCEKG